MKIKARKDRELQKKNGVALKAFPIEFKEKSVATSATSEDDEKLILLVKNMNMHLKKKRRSDPRRII